MRALRRASLAAGLGLMLVALALSSIPGSELPDLGPEHSDKLLHAVEYAVLGALLAFSRSTTRGALFAGLIAALFGVVDELYQGWTAGRDSSAADALADALGASIGVGAVLLIWRVWPGLSPSSPPGPLREATTSGA